MDDPLKLLYVLGFSYSGSTLLAFLLNAHPRIVSTGEIIGPPHFSKGKPFLCSCARPIEWCPYYRYLQDRIGLLGFNLREHRWDTRHLSENAGTVEKLLWEVICCDPIRTIRDILRRQVPALRRRECDLVNLNTKFIRAVAESRDVRIVVDSSKIPSRLPILLRCPNLDVRVVHLVRHPLDCLNSAMKYHSHPPEIVLKSWKQNFNASRFILNSYRHVPFIQVKYEDLCDNPRFWVGSICKLVDETFDESVFSFRQCQHHIVGNRMRLESSEKIQMGAPPSEDLRSRFQKYICRYLRRELLMLGYESESGIVSV